MENGIAAIVGLAGGVALVLAIALTIRSLYLEYALRKANPDDASGFLALTDKYEEEIRKLWEGKDTLGHQIGALRTIITEVQDRLRGLENSDLRVPVDSILGQTMLCTQKSLQDLQGRMDTIECEHVPTIERHGKRLDELSSDVRTVALDAQKGRKTLAENIVDLRERLSRR